MGSDRASTTSIMKNEPSIDTPIPACSGRLSEASAPVMKPRLKRFATTPASRNPSTMSRCTGVRFLSRARLSRVTRSLK